MKEELKIGHVFKNYKAICEWLGVKPASGNTKISHMKEFDRYCKYHKDGNKFIIDEVYDVPRDKVDRRENNSCRRYRKEYKGYLPTEYEDGLSGVYAIVNSDEIYVGSTCEGFRSRFRSHTNGKQEHTKKMLQDGGIFQILWVSDVEDETIIRSVEQMYIDYFMVNPDWKVINRKEETVCLSEKTRYKNKTIKVDERQYELALEILRQNGIMIGGTKQCTSN